MKKNTLLFLATFLLIVSSLIAQSSTTTPPPIPEEARRHFVMGETMFKEAKAPGDFLLAEAEFKHATDLAPQWPDARYNLALAKESTGDYAGAIADLKIYQQFKLSDAEARTVQDNIYAIEAKQQLRIANSAAKADADAANVKAQADAHAAAYQDIVKFLQGEWNGTIFDAATAHSGLSSGRASGKVRITIVDKEILIDLGKLYVGTLVRGIMTSDDLSSIKWFAHDEDRRPPNYPINLTIDKTASRIHLSWGTTYETDVNLTR